MTDIDKRGELYIVKIDQDDVIGDKTRRLLDILKTIHTKYGEVKSGITDAPEDKIKYVLDEDKSKKAKLSLIFDDVTEMVTKLFEETSNQNKIHDDKYGRFFKILIKVSSDYKIYKQFIFKVENIEKENNSPEHLNNRGEQVPRLDTHSNETGPGTDSNETGTGNAGNPPGNPLGIPNRNPPAAVTLSLHPRMPNQIGANFFKDFKYYKTEKYVFHRFIEECLLYCKKHNLFKDELDGVRGAFKEQTIRYSIDSGELVISDLIMPGTDGQINYFVNPDGILKPLVSVVAEVSKVGGGEGVAEGDGDREESPPNSLEIGVISEKGEFIDNFIDSYGINFQEILTEVSDDSLYNSLCEKVMYVKQRILISSDYKQVQFENDGESVETHLGSQSTGPPTGPPQDKVQSKSQLRETLNLIGIGESRINAKKILKSKIQIGGNYTFKLERLSEFIKRYDIILKNLTTTEAEFNMRNKCLWFFRKGGQLPKVDLYKIYMYFTFDQLLAERKILQDELQHIKDNVDRIHAANITTESYKALEKKDKDIIEQHTQYYYIGEKKNVDSTIIKGQLDELRQAHILQETNLGHFLGFITELIETIEKYFARIKLKITGRREMGKTGGLTALEIDDLINQKTIDAMIRLKAEREPESQLTAQEEARRVAEELRVEEEREAEELRAEELRAEEEREAEELRKAHAAQVARKLQNVAEEAQRATEEERKQQQAQIDSLTTQLQKVTDQRLAEEKRVAELRKAKVVENEEQQKLQSAANKARRAEEERNAKAKANANAKVVRNSESAKAIKARRAEEERKAKVVRNREAAKAKEARQVALTQKRRLQTIKKNQLKTKREAIQAIQAKRKQNTDKLQRLSEQRKLEAAEAAKAKEELREATKAQQIAARKLQNAANEARRVAEEEEKQRQQAEIERLKQLSEEQLQQLKEATDQRVAADAQRINDEDKRRQADLLQANKLRSEEELADSEIQKLRANSARKLQKTANKHKLQVNTLRASKEQQEARRLEVLQALTLELEETRVFTNELLKIRSELERELEALAQLRINNLTQFTQHDQEREANILAEHQALHDELNQAQSDKNLVGRQLEHLQGLWRNSATHIHLKEDLENYLERNSINFFKVPFDILQQVSLIEVLPPITDELNQVLLFFTNYVDESTTPTEHAKRMIEFEILGEVIHLILELNTNHGTNITLSEILEKMARYVLDSTEINYYIGEKKEENVGNVETEKHFILDIVLQRKFKDNNVFLPNCKFIQATKMWYYIYILNNGFIGDMIHYTASDLPLIPLTESIKKALTNSSSNIDESKCKTEWKLGINRVRSLQVEIANSDKSAFNGDFSILFDKYLYTYARMDINDAFAEPEPVHLPPPEEHEEDESEQEFGGGNWSEKIDDDSVVDVSSEDVFIGELSKQDMKDINELLNNTPSNRLKRKKTIIEKDIQKGAKKNTKKTGTKKNTKKTVAKKTGTKKNAKK
jgi:hypothetical protein